MKKSEYENASIAQQFPITISTSAANRSKREFNKGLTDDEHGFCKWHRKYTKEGKCVELKVTWLKERIDASERHQLQKLMLMLAGNDGIQVSIPTIAGLYQVHNFRKQAWTGGFVSKVADFIEKTTAFQQGALAAGLNLMEVEAEMVSSYRRAKGDAPTTSELQAITDAVFSGLSKAA